MSSYIDADALREKVLYHADTMNHAGNHEQAKAFNYCLCMIDDMPTVEVKRGHWIQDRLCSTSGGTYGVRRCSVCEDYYQDVGYGWNYCPNCGAKMDEREEEQ